MAKPPGRCIFCDGRPLSKEHVFGDWLRDIFPRDAGTTHTDGVINWGAGGLTSAEATVITRKRQGHAGTRKVRVVCKTCNNGWMSLLEERTKPLLKPLIAGQDAVLDANAQKTLATWAAKTAITAEHLKPRPGMIRPNECRWIKDNLAPPEGCHVWVAAYDGHAWRELTIYQQRANLDITAINGPTLEPHYIKATTFGLGNLLFLILSTSWDKAWRQFVDYDTVGLRHIWPITRKPIQWPPPFVLSDSEATMISNILNWWDTESVFDPRTYRTSAD